MLQGLDAAWKGALNYTVFRTNPTDSLNRPPRTQPFALSSTQSAKASAPARTRGRRADEKNDFIIKISQKAVLINRASRNIKQELSSYFLNLLVERTGYIMTLIQREGGAQHGLTTDGGLVSNWKSLGLWISVTTETQKTRPTPCSNSQCSLPCHSRYRVPGCWRPSVRLVSPGKNSQSLY